MNYATIAASASTRLATLRTEQDALTKKVRALDAAIAALGDHDASSLLRDELAGLKSQTVALAKRSNAIKSLITSAKACAALQDHQGPANG